jgi:hypothetical protein
MQVVGNSLDLHHTFSIDNVVDLCWLMMVKGQDTARRYLSQPYAHRSRGRFRP